MEDWIEKATGIAWRFMGLLVLLVIALLILGISFVGAVNTESISERQVSRLLPDSIREGSWIPALASVVLTTLPGAVRLILQKHATNQFLSSCKKAWGQVSDFLRGKNNQRAGATLWTLLQLDLVLLWPMFGVGGVVQAMGWTPEPIQPEVKEVVEVRYVTRPVADRIYFSPGRSGTGQTFAPKGSEVSGPAKRMLQRTVGALNLAGECRASVVLHGFASDEEFKSASGDPDHLKNLELADHRAQAVFDELRCMPQYQDKLLRVEISNRWTPAIKESESIEERLRDMEATRNGFVLRGNQGFKEPDEHADTNDKKRDAQLDRVVVLEWKLDEACRVSAETEAIRMGGNQ